MRIIGAMLVRNESGRYLEKVLAQMDKVCDRIVVVDDGSTDDTVSICKSYGAKVHTSPKPLFEVNELAQRKRLFSLAAQMAGPGGWVLCLDADETFAEEKDLRLAAEKAEAIGCDGINFRLYDMWDETHYRSDKWWNAHLREWLMMVRIDPLREYEWREQPLHCGRFPLNAATKQAFAEIHIQHWGWASNRQEKYERYKRIDTGGYGVAEQYESILEENPRLIPYGGYIREPFQGSVNASGRVLLCSPVRQSAEVFTLFQESVKALRVPKGVKLDTCYILHNSPELAPYVQGEYYTYSTNDEYSVDGETHNWKDANINAVINMKNRLIRHALDHHYDYIFFVDSDLVLHPDTLLWLLQADKDMTVEVFWSRWTPKDELAPNAWDYDQYEFLHHSKTKWKEPGLYKVGMAGACSLIKRKVLEAGVDFTMLPNISFWGEDRAFCIRLAAHNFECWLDTHVPPHHLYRREDIDSYLTGR